MFLWKTVLLSLISQMIMLIPCALFLSRGAFSEVFFNLPINSVVQLFRSQEAAYRALWRKGKIRPRGLAPVMMVLVQLECAVSVFAMFYPVYLVVWDLERFQQYYVENAYPSAKRANIWPVTNWPVWWWWTFTALEGGVFFAFQMRKANWPLVAPALLLLLFAYQLFASAYLSLTGVPTYRFILNPAYNKPLAHPHLISLPSPDAPWSVVRNKTVEILSAPVLSSAPEGPKRFLQSKLFNASMSTPLDAKALVSALDFTRANLWKTVAADVLAVAAVVWVIRRERWFVSAARTPIQGCIFSAASATLVEMISSTSINFQTSFFSFLPPAVFHAYFRPRVALVAFIFAYNFRWTILHRLQAESDLAEREDHEVLEAVEKLRVLEVAEQLRPASETLASEGLRHRGGRIDPIL